MSTRRYAVLPLLLSIACATPPAPPPLSRNLFFDGLQEVTAWEGAEEVVVFVTAQQFLSRRQNRRGLEYFHARATERPDRPLFKAWEAVFEAKVAGEVPLLSRIGWVKQSIRHADEAVALGGSEQAPLLRLVRGLLLAELPPRFEQSDRATADLRFVLEHREVFPFDPSRGLYRGLARAALNGGHPEAARSWLDAAGASTDDEPLILDGHSTGPTGSRFTSERIREVAPGVLVLEGLDFSDFAFLRGERGLIAIDTGSTMAAARDALDRVRSRWGGLEVEATVFTHGHWDHVGGAQAFPAGRRIADQHFPETLARTNLNRAPFDWMFAAPSAPLEVALTDVVAGSTELRVDGRQLRLVSLPGGETADGLLVLDRTTGTAFVGDAFMPYLGAPTEAEGSPEGLVETLRVLEGLRPKQLVHGHPQLTWFITAETIPALRPAMSELLAQVRKAIHDGESIEDFRDRLTVPTTLRASPKAVFPFLILRDGFIERTWRREAGYWTRRGDIDRFSRAELARAVALVGGDQPGAFVKAIDRLRASGDDALALEVTKLGLEIYPQNGALLDRRRLALSSLREQAHLLDPFRFVVYSQLENAPLPPVSSPRPPAGASSDAASERGHGPTAPH